MKHEYTHIIGVESNAHGVKITVQPKGDNEEPMTISVTPNDGYIHINVCGLEQRGLCLLPTQMASNTTDIQITPRGERDKQIGEYKRQGRIPR